MRFLQLAGRRRPAVVAISVIAAGATALAITTAGSAQAEQQNNDVTSLYIVQLVDEPLASYDGGVAGLAATRPAQGQKVDAGSSAARAYRNYLSTKKRDVLSRTRIAENRKAGDFSTAFNGFSARLTAAEAERLAHAKGVAKVWENEIVTVDTVTTPTFLGLTGNNGVWKKQFGNVGRAGEGVIVGVLDTGFTPENPSFGPLPEPRPDAGIIAGKWSGTCDIGVEEFVACNNKVIGARYYNASGLAQPFEYLSPRDFNGHGSHTASTAAGNNGVTATIFGDNVGQISGMAPAARLAIYKVLWHNPVTGGASGGTADLVAAIDQSVADGVDVINYSISGSTTFVVDSVEIAFLNAAAGGVFVAASAGNNGPAASTVAHNSPWLTTVAASTHNRSVTKRITLGNGATYTGVGVGPAVPSAPLIDSVNAGLAGAPADSVRLCFSDADNNPTNGVVPVLDPALVTGKIVLCERGVTARIDKSAAVAAAGGIGMIMFNPVAGQSVNADFHAVSTVHTDEVVGAAVKAYAATAGPTAAISALLPDPVTAPVMAGFSSAGPARAGNGDLLKPDITAPGVDVIAAYSPATRGLDFDGISGTSMSSPHIAGLAALLKSDNPSWSPMWIKSALMTTAGVTDNAGQPIQRVGDATPLDFGNGHVRPGPSFDPGLVYDSGVEDWLEYACSINQLQLITAPSFCASLDAIDPSDLNYPSISVGDLAGSQTITRTVTNISKFAGVYLPHIQAPAGFKVSVSPKILVVPKSMSKSFTVTITRTTGPIGTYAFGSLTWKDVLGRSVRSSIAVRPVALAVAPETSLTGASGQVTAKAGYTGTLNASVTGLVGATVTDFNLDTTGPDFNPNAPAAGAEVGLATVTIPAGTSIARFATFDADYPANTDVDVFVYRMTGPSSRVLVAQSAGGTSQEVVTLNNPLAGTYEVYVDLFSVSPGTTMTVHLNHWLVPPTAVGNMTPDPASQSVTTGQVATVTLNWTGLTPGLRYLGTVSFSDGTATLGRTIVTVS